LRSQRFNPHFLILVAGVVPLFFGAILLHELGHWAAGLMAGFQFAEFQVGPVLLLRSHGWVRPQLVGSLRLLTGHVRVNENQKFSTPRYSVLVAGGPVASALGAGTFLGLAYAFGERVSADWPIHVWSVWQWFAQPRSTVGVWLVLAGMLN